MSDFKKALKQQEEFCNSKKDCYKCTYEHSEYCKAEFCYQQGREDVCNTLTDLCTRWVDDDGNCWNTDCPFCDDVCKIEQLKEQS